MLDGKTIWVVAAEPGEFCDFCGRDIHVGERFRYSSAMDDGKFCTQHLCAPCGRMWDGMSNADDEQQLSEVDVKGRLWNRHCDDCGMESNCMNTPPQKCLFVRAEYGDTEASDYIRKHYPVLDTESESTQP